MRGMTVFFIAVTAFGWSGQSAFSATEVAPGVLNVGTIKNPAVTESSGIQACRGRRGAFWTHNDSGLDMIYSMATDGRSLGQWKIKNAEMDNIEDIGTSPGRLYLADVGNDTGAKTQVVVYAIPEPPAVGKGNVAVVRAWRLNYPGDPFDCESFFVFRNFGYLISKDLSKGEARLYRFPLNRRGTAFTLEQLCKLDVNDNPRGADITPDGRRLAVITTSGAYLFSFPNGIPTEGIVDRTLFVRFEHDSMEGCTFTPTGLMVTSESRDLFLFTDAQFRYPAPRAGR